MENKKRKQIAFDVSQEIHKQIKLAAFLRNITMNNWLNRAIYDRLKKEALEFPEETIYNQ